MAESSAANFTVGKIQKDWGQRVAKMYGQQKRNIIHTSSTAYEQDHSAAAPLSSVMNSHRFIRSPRRRGRARSAELRCSAGCYPPCPSCLWNCLMQINMPGARFT
jgi:hypothetical protein